MKGFRPITKNIGLSLLVIVLISVNISSCDKDEDVKREFPRVSTLEVIEISEEGATFQGNIDQYGSSEITQIGFVWSETEEPNSSSESIILETSRLVDGYFNYQVKTRLKDNEEYFIRAFVIDDSFTTYGEITSFTSLGSGAPEILDFEPKKVLYGDTVSITGQNFSNKNLSNNVTFGISDGKVIFSSDTLIKVIVPSHGLSLTHDLSVTIVGNKATASQQVSLIPLELTDIQKRSAKSYDTLTFTGVFGVIPNHISVMFNEVSAEIYSNKRNELKVVVPPGIDNPVNISLSVGVQNTSADYFDYLKPTITNIPVSGTWLEELIIEGANFQTGDYKGEIIMKRGGQEVSCEITERTSEMIKFLVPTSLTRYPNTTITLKDSGHILISNFSFKEPIIESILPNEATYGDEITIRGQYFHPSNNFLNIHASNHNIISSEIISTNEIKFLMPNGIKSTNGLVTVRIGTGDATYLVDLENIITLKPPEIIDFIPKIVENIGDQIVITGENFSPQLSNNTVMFNGGQMKIVSSSNTEIIAEVKSLNIDDILVTENTKASMVITSGGQSSESADELEIDYYGPWTEIQNIPDEVIAYRSSQTEFEKTILFIAGYNSSPWPTDIWEYNVALDTWNIRTQIPGVERHSAFFQKNENGFYFGLGWGQTEFLEDLNYYNFALNHWTSVSRPVSFSQSYASYYDTDLYHISRGIVQRYNSLNDSWIQTSIIEYPDPHVSNGAIFEKSGFIFNDLPHLLVRDQSFNDLRKAYLRFYQFQSNSEWVEIGVLDKSYNWGSIFDIAFFESKTIINSIYDIFYLDMTDFSLSLIQMPYVIRDEGIIYSVSASNGVYFMLENGSFWRFDPTFNN
ncbi:MAG: hypothetical protein GY816_04265 [Cytophagales bacterium]|nr:hypothetical protein [Cytophagales bacterium]